MILGGPFGGNVPVPIIGRKNEEFDRTQFFFQCVLVRLGNLTEKRDRQVKLFPGGPADTGKMWIEVGQ